MTKNILFIEAFHQTLGMHIYTGQDKPYNNKLNHIIITGFCSPDAVWPVMWSEKVENSRRLAKLDIVFSGDKRCDFFKINDFPEMGLKMILLSRLMLLTAINKMILIATQSLEILSHKLQWSNGVKFISLSFKIICSVLVVDDPS